MKTTAPTEKKTRVVSPEIAALRKEHAEKVAALKLATASSAVRQRIIDLLEKLTPDDKTVVLNAIKPAN